MVLAQAQGLLGRGQLKHYLAVCSSQHSDRTSLLSCSGYGGGGEGGLTNELDSLRKVVREQAAQCQYLKEQLRSGCLLASASHSVDATP